MNSSKSRIWEGKSGSASVGSGGGAFNGNRPISREEWPANVNVGTGTVTDFLEKVFFPPVAPDCSISVDNPVREVGQTTAYTLTWAAVKKTNPITGITVDGNAIPVTGEDQDGTAEGNVAAAIGAYVKSITVTDGELSQTKSCSITYRARMFWGTIAKDGTTQPITDADVLALPGSELRDDFKKTFAGFGGDGKRLIFAFPALFGTPSFYINGFAVTAFTKVRSASAFVNAYGATVSMDVWVSDNAYNSPLASVQLT